MRSLHPKGTAVGVGAVFSLMTAVLAVAQSRTFVVPPLYPTSPGPLFAMATVLFKHIPRSEC